MCALEAFQRPQAPQVEYEACETRAVGLPSTLWLWKVRKPCVLRLEIPANILTRPTVATVAMHFAVKLCHLSSKAHKVK